MSMSGRVHKTKRSVRQNRGESMVYVIVLLMVFVILGGAVLTASASASATASARIAERQAYYYARSTLDVLDEAVREGKLGQAVRDAVMDALVQSGLSSLRYTKDAPLTLVYRPGVSAAPLTDIVFSDVTITCTGRAESGTQATGMQMTKAALQLRTVDLDFSVGYQNQTVAMHIQYRCTCNVEQYDAGTGEGIWKQDWIVQTVG